MANKPLKSIQFPGLSDTYTVPQVDATLATSGAAADAKKVGDEISDLKQDLQELDTALDTKANVDGSYDTMTVGNAKQLVSTVNIEDKAPYLFRTSGGSADIGDREYDSIVGGSVAWNQLVKNGDFSDGETNWVKVDANVSVSNGVYTVTKTASGGYACRQSIPMIATHKVLQTFHIKGANGVKYNTNGEFPQLTGNGAWQVVERIAVRSQTANIVFLISTNETSDFAEFSVKNVMYIDLTAMFGSTIADYVYSLESATAGTGIAWLRKYGFFTKPYYAYDAGSLQSVQTSAHRMTGFNQWDEEWRNGYYQAANGQYVSNANYICNTNPIRVQPSTTYYIKTNGVQWEIYEYDANGNYLRQLRSAIVDSTLTTDADTYFLNIGSHTQMQTYNNDVCLNLSWDGERDGEYEEYIKHSYPLDSDLTLRGIPKLDASNNLYYDGDTYEADGTVTRRYGSITFNGTEDWRYSSTNGFVFLTLNNTTFPYAMKSNVNAISNKYAYIGTASGSYQNVLTNKTFLLYMASSSGGQNVREIAILDTAYTSKEDFKTSLASNPLTVVYELQTPTTDTADPFQSPQIVDDFGTEEYVLANDAFPMPVGHVTQYQPNLRAKLEMAPDSPDGAGDYLVRQTNGQNEYVEYVSPVPSSPTEDGTYVLKATVSDGTATLTWVAEGGE